MYSLNPTFFPQPAPPPPPPKYCRALQDDTKGAEADKPDVAKEEEKPAEEAKVPEVASVLVKGRLCEDKQKWKSACISLDGLLDYDEEDRSDSSKILSQKSRKRMSSR